MDWRVAAASLAVAAVAALRRQLKSGKPIFPRFRARVYVSVKSPQQDPNETPSLERIRESDPELGELGDELDSDGDELDRRRGGKPHGSKR